MGVLKHIGHEAWVIKIEVTSGAGLVINITRPRKLTFQFRRESTIRSISKSLLETLSHGFSGYFDAMGT